MRKPPIRIVEVRELPNGLWVYRYEADHDAPDMSAAEMYREAYLAIETLTLERRSATIQ